MVFSNQKRMLTETLIFSMILYIYIGGLGFEQAGFEILKTNKFFLYTNPT